MIQWTTEQRALSDLIPYEHNPRTMTKAQAKRLQRSLEETGYAEIIAINRDNVIIAGHQRHAIMSKLHSGDHVIDVRVPDRFLTDREFKNYLIASNKDNGDFDFDILAAMWEVDELLEHGFTMEDLGLDLDLDEEKPKKRKTKRCPECGHEW